MKALQHVGQPLLIPGETSESAHPAEIPFHHPAPGQEHKAPLDLGQFDDLERDAVVSGGLAWRLTGVPLVHVGQRHRLPGRLLHGGRQVSDLGLVLVIGGRDMQGEQLTQRINGEVDLGALAPFGPIPARAIPAFRRTLLRLSRIMALGWGSRPSPMRISSRRSATIVSKTPASIQRRVC